MLQLSIFIINSYGGIVNFFLNECCYFLYICVIFIYFLNILFWNLFILEPSFLSHLRLLGRTRILKQVLFLYELKITLEIMKSQKVSN